MQGVKEKQGVKKKYLTPALICCKIHTIGARDATEVINKMDKIYEQTMLFDFYGELLTEHQRSVYMDAVYNDLSLGEIAEERGISRQGVHDLIRRCDRILQDYESKLHLVERFAGAKETIRRIQELAGGVAATGTDSSGDRDRIYGIEPSRETEEALRERLYRIGDLSRQLLREL